MVLMATTSLPSILYTRDTGTSAFCLQMLHQFLICTLLSQLWSSWFPSPDLLPAESFTSMPKLHDSHGKNLCLPSLKVLPHTQFSLFPWKGIALVPLFTSPKLSRLSLVAQSVWETQIQAGQGQYWASHVTNHQVLFGKDPQKSQHNCDTTN